LYDNPWFSEKLPFEDDDIEEGVVGFVYVITNQQTGKKYIGQKKFTKTRRVVSKTKRPRRVHSSSDWHTYYGSNDELQRDVASDGPQAFRREIIHLCRSKGMMNYLELKEQVLNDVLLKPEEYYNSFVGGKIHRKHVYKKP
jgi:Putative endonuclease segE, GIY-YIG domain